MSVPVIQIKQLVRQFGKTDAVNGFNLTVQPGRCYGLFGRNGAGKTTTIKCLLDLLKPTSGSVEMFGMNPAKYEVEVRSRLAYVPDQLGFYPWMSVVDHFQYLASFRKHWNLDMQMDLVEQFHLDLKQKINHLSKGQKMQVALIGALCPEPELLILDEPTSGLDPLIRREFIRTVIGAYQDVDPENRTVFVSTHLITEFEGLIDEFTIMDRGRELVTMETDQAREQYKRLVMVFHETPAAPDLPGVMDCQIEGREMELWIKGDEAPVRAWAESHKPDSIESQAMTLEEIFLSNVKLEEQNHVASTH